VRDDGKPKHELEMTGDEKEAKGLRESMIRLGIYWRRT
jgi:hypothetical protein